METKIINALDLYLDSENPRHDYLDEQNDIIKRLIKFEKVKDLAKDICDMNSTSPFDRMGVVLDERGNFIVVEGNRRACALKLLKDPTLAPSEDRDFFIKKSKLCDESIFDIECVLFSDRESANPWLARRHNGEQNGVGLKSWDAPQKARFFDYNNNALALSILDYANKYGFITEEEKQDKVLTTASRFLGNPYFRTTIGVVTGRSESDVKIDVTFEDFDRVISRFCRDLLSTNENKVVHSRTRKIDWENYAKRLVSEGVAPVHHSREIISIKDKEEYFKRKNATGSEEEVATGGNTEGYKPTENLGSYQPTDGNGAPEELDLNTSDTGSKGGSTTGGRDNQSPDKRECIIPSSFKVKIKNNIFKRIYDEVKRVNCNMYTLSATLTCRVFLENAYHEYYEHVYGNYPSGMETHRILGKIVDFLEKGEKISRQLTKKEKSSLSALKKVQSNENSYLSPKSLGANAHGAIYPSDIAIKREWDNINDIILFIMKELEQR
ncbi:hypothetical protein [Pectobacterium sp. B1J-3]|uniref:hypothetical protein n=1 Tax=Pectobacterium sp. B1J-3 TaxID=3385371 RepID=UPI003906BCBD